MGGSWAKRPVLKKTGCNRSTTGLFDFQQTGQLATGLITIHRNWQLQSSCDQLRSSPVASLCTSCQLDFKTLSLSLSLSSGGGLVVPPHIGVVVCGGLLIVICGSFVLRRPHPHRCHCRSLPHRRRPVKASSFSLLVLADRPCCVVIVIVR